MTKTNISFDIRSAVVAQPSITTDELMARFPHANKSSVQTLRSDTLAVLDIIGGIKRSDVSIDAPLPEVTLAVDDAEVKAAAASLSSEDVSASAMACFTPDISVENERKARKKAAQARARRAAAKAG